MGDSFDRALTVVRRAESGRLAIAALIKRSYALERGKLAVADEQDELIGDPELASDKSAALLDDTDLVAPKPATDVIVHGTIAAPAACTELMFGVAVGAHARTLRAIGPRVAEVAAGGAVRFSAPEPFERLELGWQHAYGGYDAEAHDLLDPPDDETIALLAAVARGEIADDGEFPIRPESLFAYPRNPAGTAYRIDVDRRRADGTPLPRIEDPRDALNPERFFVPSPPAWIDAPIAAGLGWVQHSWYPRIVRFVGPILEHDPPARPLREAELGDGDDLLDLPTRDPERIFPRALCGAAPGMARAILRGDEPIVLEHLHPEHPRLGLSLPGEVPHATLTPPGLKALSPPATLQTVRIDTDALRLSLTWCAIVPLAANVDDAFLERTELAVRFRRL